MNCVRSWEQKKSRRKERIGKGEIEGERELNRWSWKTFAVFPFRNFPCGFPNAYQFVSCGSENRGPVPFPYFGNRGRKVSRNNSSLIFNSGNKRRARPTEIRETSTSFRKVFRIGSKCCRILCVNVVSLLRPQSIRSLCYDAICHLIAIYRSDSVCDLTS